jgi:glycosyltransferase involved in cell wall biosynthesis
MNKVSIILPCYNPPANWVSIVAESYAKITSRCNDLVFKLVVVNDGSSVLSEDVKTLERLIPEALFLSYEINHGKGYALRYGVKHAPESDYYILTDIDFPFEDSSTQALIEQLTREQFDVLLGHRNQENYYDKVPFVRRNMSKMFRFFIKRIAGNNITDTQCGLKGFSKKAKPYFIRTTINRYLFDLEFIVSFKNDNELKIGVLPVVLKEGIIFRKMGFKILIREFFNLIKILV